MSWNGMLPKGVTCKRCGSVLQGEGEDRPAELYLGMYNGLCYPCTNAAPFELNYSYVSGARVFSHPPHCPSWRRDREQFYGFDGCQVCGGQGRVWVSRSDAFGGSYTVQCQACHDRHNSHPLVIELRRLAQIKILRRAVLIRRVDKKFCIQIAAAGYDAGVYTQDVMLGNPTFRKIYESVKAELSAIENGGPIPEDWPALNAKECRQVVRGLRQDLSEAEALDIVSKASGGPPYCPIHPSYHGNRAPQIRKGEESVCPNCLKLYQERRTK